MIGKRIDIDVVRNVITSIRDSPTVYGHFSKLAVSNPLLEWTKELCILARLWYDIEKWKCSHRRHLTSISRVGFLEPGNLPRSNISKRRDKVDNIKEIIRIWYQHNRCNNQYPNRADNWSISWFRNQIEMLWELLFSNRVSRTLIFFIAVRRNPPLLRQKVF